MPLLPIHRVRRPVRIAAAAFLLAAAFGWLRADDSGEARLLLLKSGRVVSGRISQSAGGYVVEKPRGNMLIPFDQVDFPARDLRDAYRILEQRQDHGATAETYLATARWCVTYQLYEEAREELRKALTLDERDAEARLMLKRLDDVLRSAGPGGAATAQRSPTTTDGFERPEARSLAGLSQDTARTFVSRVQPILLHKCGNASCHGQAATNGFRLTHTRTHRVFAERNLAMALQFVDPQQPQNSPLLVVPRGNHGPAGETIFHGSVGAEQLQTLQRWLVAAVEDQRKGIDRTKSLLGDTGDLPGALVLIRGRRAASEEAPQAGSPPPDDLLEKILRDEREDAFDPNEFNRKFHGAAQK